MPGKRLSTGLRLSVAGLLAAVAAVATTAPAHADTWAGSINVDTQDLTIGTSGPGEDLSVDFSIFPPSIAPTTFTNAVLTIDTSALTGAASVTTADSRCSTAGTEITCAFGTLTAVDYLGAGATVVLHVKALSGATAGQSGQLIMTGSADGLIPQTRPGTITLADGPDLVTPTGSDVSAGAARGSTITTPHITLTNIGSESAQGVTLVFSAPYEFPFIHLARNCEYASSPGTYGNLTVASCYFDNVIPVGSTYTIKRSQQATVRADSVYDFVSYISDQVFPGYRPPSATAPGLTWVRGTEQQLRLDKTSDGGTSTTTSSQVAQTEINQFDGLFIQRYRVTDGVSSDLAAIGDTVTAADGSTTAVTIGAQENGPGSLDYGPGLTPAAVISFSPPAGTTVTSVPDGCEVGYGVPYRCEVDGLFLVGTSQTFTFQLQIAAGGVTGAGSVSVVHGWNGHPPTGPDVYDSTWDNNTASVTINP